MLYAVSEFPGSFKSEEEEGLELGDGREWNKG